MPEPQNPRHDIFLLIEVWSSDQGSMIMFTRSEFFKSALADGLSQEFEWQQVSSNLQDSSQYSGRSQ